MTDRGNLIKLEHRMVARGVGQIIRLYFSETFAPTPAAASMEIVVTVANENDWLSRHLEINQAFIRSHLDEVVFMRLPDDCGDMNGRVVLLQRAVYELHQAGRQ